MSDTVSKKDIVAAMAKEAGISQKDAAAALDAFTSLVGKSVKKNNRVSIIGFGSFSLSKRAARTGRNPATGETIKIKASKSVSFKAGKALKDSL
ncbi:DNA-binding protein HU [Oceanococcus atlanticus]|uniref:DNA-binding protein HU n=1 Tax=Oceanococcus atlanticus TaxID=1317117 RepID=A0A1Y1SCZ4_9GAMM|nr:HU family DNA-binding protein [Oceanococcus atlanticus]ORE86885.1 DNA-binding protein HU [Oceanococcus atlanticus]RZO83750.1 MAG: HU family DNA-binding protein [Oceanococcus sp.]